MTAYEIIMIIVTVMSLMMNLSMSIVALLAYIESRNKRKKISQSCSAITGLAMSVKDNHTS